LFYIQLLICVSNFIILLFTFLSRAENSRDFPICGLKGEIFSHEDGGKSSDGDLEIGTWFYSHPVKTLYYICFYFGLNPYFFSKNYDFWRPIDDLLSTLNLKMKNHIWSQNLPLMTSKVVSLLGQKIWVRTKFVTNVKIERIKKFI
jgi:hypothetical protein